MSYTVIYNYIANGVLMGNRYENIFNDREDGILTTYSKRQLSEDEMIDFHPAHYIPESVVEKLSVSSLAKIFYSDHAEDRNRERGMPHFHRLDFNNCHAGQIDHRKSNYNQHNGVLLKDGGYKVEIDKVRATYNPVHGKTEIINMNIRIKGVIGMGRSDEENKKPENQLDSILVLDIKKGKRGDDVGVMVTGWMKAGDDYPPKHKYTNKQDFQNFIEKMDKGYRLSKFRSKDMKKERNRNKDISTGNTIAEIKDIWKKTSIEEKPNSKTFFVENEENKNELSSDYDISKQTLSDESNRKKSKKKKKKKKKKRIKARQYGIR